jgi:aminoglycoside 2''-phosphotransferase
MGPYLQSIQSDYPELSIRDSELIGRGGQYNEILIVNKDIIFRFPMFEEGLETLQREIRLLKALQGKLFLPIPQPVYLSRNINTVGKVFMGYHKIQGEPLWYERFQAIKDQKVLKKIASQLAAFLHELRSLPVKQLGLDLPINDQAQEWAILYEEIRNYLYPKMRADARERVSNYFETYLNTPELHNFEPTLRHGDFGSGNILYDEQEESISGIIDFGSAGLGDPAVDIAAVMTFGESFFKHYYVSSPGIDGMLERAKFYNSTFALQEALYGLKHDDQEAFERGMAAYK